MKINNIRSKKCAMIDSEQFNVTRPYVSRKKVKTKWQQLTKPKVLPDLMLLKKVLKILVKIMRKIKARK